MTWAAQDRILRRLSMVSRPIRMMNLAASLLNVGAYLLLLSLAVFLKFGWLPAFSVLLSAYLVPRFLLRRFMEIPAAEKELATMTPGSLVHGDPYSTGG